MDGSVRIRLGIAYDGSGFHGWGRQPGLRTVQGVLEDALAVLFGHDEPPPTLVVAGRTDARVHARGQVAHLQLTPSQLRRLLRGRPLAEDGTVPLAARVNGVVGYPADVVVTSSAIAAEGFDARFSATWRRYEYRIADAAAMRDPLQRHRTTWYPRALDDELMAITSSGLLGLGDFAAYCKPRPEATTIRTLQRFDWHRDADGVLIATLQADAFCHSMVRSLVGAAVAVGEGRLRSDRMRALMQADARSGEFAVQPGRGLTLLEVGYPPDAELAEQAARTRAKREFAD
jgi:tRNA pseudouridine38-40 synthase